MASGKSLLRKYKGVNVNTEITEQNNATIKMPLCIEAGTRTGHQNLRDRRKSHAFILISRALKESGRLR